ncbi:hypothetical protein [Vallitalea okinawensis]|uniref:hypothetical protein n=1 Tax=Vallitalea okinawensis TaxID=2078660 RepID=UPI000CFC0EE1|nr:hypothetical protein [Vallitalea okinawensis]
MKKMYLGTLLYLSGFVGNLLLLVISIFKPCTYNSISGFKGFLLCYDATSAYTLFWLLIIVGILISVTEAYKIDIRKKK